MIAGERLNKRSSKSKRQLLSSVCRGLILSLNSLINYLLCDPCWNGQSSLPCVKYQTHAGSNLWFPLALIATLYTGLFLQQDGNLKLNVLPSWMRNLRVSTQLTLNMHNLFYTASCQHGAFLSDPSRPDFSLMTHVVGTIMHPLWQLSFIFMMHRSTFINWWVCA